MAVAVGTAVVLVAALFAESFIRFENSFDKWFPAHDRLDRIEVPFDQEPDSRLPLTPPGLQSLLAGLSGFVENSFRLSQPKATRFRLAHDSRLVVLSVSYVDPGLVELLGLPVLAGEPLARVLARPDTLVLTASTAERLFPGEPFEAIVGRPLWRERSGDERRIGAVMADLPPNTHFRWEALASMLFPPPEIADQGSRAFLTLSVYTYLLLKHDVDHDAAERAIAQRLKAVVEQSPVLAMFAGARQLALVPVAAIYSADRGIGEMRPPRDNDLFETMILMRGFALLLFVIYFVLHMDLAAGRQARFIALRRIHGMVPLGALAVGARVVLSSLVRALALATVLAVLILTWGPAGLPALSDWVKSGAVAAALPAVFCYFAAAAVIAIVPFFRLCRSGLVALTRSRRTGRERGWVGGFLLAVEAALAVFVSFSALVAWRQYDLLRGLDRGIPLAHRFAVRVTFPHDPQLVSRVMASVSQQSPFVASGTSDAVLPLSVDLSRPVMVPARGMRVQADLMAVTPGFFEAVGLVARYGRLPAAVADTVHRSNDSAAVIPAVVSRRFALALHPDAPAKAVGEHLQIIDVAEDLQVSTPTLEVRAVVDDVRWADARLRARPTVYFLPSNPRIATSVIHAPGMDAEDVSSQLEALWREHAGSGSAMPFTVVPLREALNSIDIRFLNRLALLTISSAALILSCALGMFAQGRIRARALAYPLALHRLFGAGIGNLIRLAGWALVVPALVGGGAGLAAGTAYSQRWLAAYEVHVRSIDGAALAVVAGLGILTIAGLLLLVRDLTARPCSAHLGAE